MDNWAIFWKCAQVKTAPLNLAGAKDQVYISLFVMQPYSPKEKTIWVEMAIETSNICRDAKGQILLCISMVNTFVYITSGQSFMCVSF